MVGDGHDVTMICSGPIPFAKYVDGVRVIRLGVPYDNGMSFWERMRSFARFMVGASRLTVGREFDVIFASSTPLTVAIPALVGSLLRRVPYVFEVRDVWPEVPIELGILTNPVLVSSARLVERLAYAGASAIVALSPGMAESVRHVNPRREVVVVPNGSDELGLEYSGEFRADYREKFGWRGPVVVYSGSLGRIYDPLWLVDLAGALSAVGVRLVVSGEGAGLEPGRRRAAEMGLDPLAVLPGPMPKRDVPALLVAADAVFSSVIDEEVLHAASINKVFDAYSAGRPVFLNHDGWLTDISVHAGAGWRVSRNVELAARTIVGVLRDPSTMKQASSASSLLAQQFSRGAQYSVLIDVLESAAAGR